MSDEDFAEDSDETASNEEEDIAVTKTPVKFESYLEFEEPLNYLTYDEATRCLCMLGKNDSGLKYSYLMLNASEMNLTDISVIPTFRNVLFVDVSGNRLTQSSLEILLSMTYLLMLKADRNRIKSPKMESMLYLQVLSLNRNDISDTLGISHRLLECLELNNNRINSVNLNPYVLENIKVLELRGNFLTTTNGIFFPSLVSLYIGDNKIKNIEGFDTLINLKTLHARGNFISILDGLNIPTCVKLSYINLRDNKITKFNEVMKLRNLTGLKTLIISQNPVARSIDKDKDDQDDEETYGFRIKLIAVIPNLIRINKQPVLDEERENAKELRQRMLEDGKSFSDADSADQDE